MKKIILLFIICCATVLNAQNYEWSKSFADDNYANIQSLSSDLSGNIVVGMGFQNTVDFDFGAGVTSLTSAGNWDGCFAKYNSAGDLVWTKNIGGGGLDIIQNTITDQNGNVYILGFFQNTADFDPSAGQYLLSASTLQDIFFAKYDSNGNLLWAKNLGGGVYNVPRSIVVDPTGNVFVMGYFQGTADFDPSATGVFNMTNVHGNSFWDTFFAKYDESGNFIWAQKIEGTSDVVAKDLVIDNSGNIYLAGSFFGIADFNLGTGTANLDEANGSYFFAKYDANGNYIWANNLNAFSGRGNIALDNSGNIYLTGSYVFTVDFDPSSGVSTLNSSNSYNIFFAKYTSSGNFIWAKSIDNFSTEVSKGIAVDQYNNIYLDGLFYGDADFDPNSGTHILSSNPGAEFVAKYNLNGDFVFVNDIQPLYDVDNKAFAINNQGDIYVGGNFRDLLTLNNTSEVINSNGQQHGFFVKYNQPTNAGNDQSICLGNSAQFYGYSPNAVSYLWDFGDSSTSTVLNPTHLYSSAGNYTVLFTAYDSIGGSTSDTTNVNIASFSFTTNILGQTTNLCTYNIFPYDIASPNIYNNYTWNVPAGSIIYSGQGTSHLELYFDNTAIGGTLSVTETNVCGATNTDSINLATPGLASVIGNITGPAELCPIGNPIVTYYLDSIIPEANYVWTIYGDATIISGQGTDTILVNLSSSFNSGTILVHSTSSCGDSPDSYLNINSIIETPSAISGQTTGFCSTGGSATYSISALANALSYTWTVPAGATINSGQGTTDINVSFDNTFSGGEVSVSAINTCGTGPSSVTYLNAPEPTPAPGSIIGQQTSLCPAENLVLTYYVLPMGDSTSTYTWNITGDATIINGQGTYSVTVAFDTTFTTGNISVVLNNECGSSAPTDMSLFSGPPSSSFYISGQDYGLCNSTGVLYTILPTNNNTYTWTVPSGATIISGQGTDSVLVSFDSTFTNGLIEVFATSACGNSNPVAMYLNNVPLQPQGGIMGQFTEVCGLTSTTYAVVPVEGATSYTWIVPAGITIISGQGTDSINVNIDSTFTVGVLTVTANNACGSSYPLSQVIETTPNQVYFNGPYQELCNYLNSTVTYSLNANNYVTVNWTVPAGMTIIDGQGTSYLTVFIDSTFTDGDLSGDVSNSCGSRPFSIHLSTVPEPFTALVGDTANLCAGSGNTYLYYVSGGSGSTTYNWTVPTGANIYYGQGSPVILLTVDNTFTGGTISVDGINSCGSTTISITAQPAPLLPTPGPISGTKTGLCPAGISSMGYSIDPLLGAASYTWTAPTGVTIVYGQGTDSIYVTIDNTFTFGTLSVYGTNICGINSTASTIQLRSTLATPSAVSGSSSVCENENGLTYSITSVSAASSYVWTVPSGASIISGQGTNSVVVNWGSSSGDLTVSSVNACGQSTPRSKHVATHTCHSFDSLASSESEPEILIYPNPNSGLFSLTINDSLNQNVSIKITNVLGETVYTGQTTSDTKMDLNLEGNAKGMYMIQLSTADKTYLQKIVIQ